MWLVPRSELWESQGPVGVLRGRTSMQTGLPDPAALDEAFTLLWPLPLALSLSDLLYQGPISPTIPAKHREVVVGGGL